MASRTGARAAASAGLAALVALTSACATGSPSELPTVGSPSPSPTVVGVDSGRADQLAREWGLVGAALPDDWPDVPLPRDTEVITAYAIGAEPRRTWTATFAADRGTALDLAEPVVAELRERGYQPIAEYVGTAETNTGLYSFAAAESAVYIVLGEDNGRPNIVITVRGTSNALMSPTGAPAPSGSATAEADPSSAPPASTAPEASGTP